MNAIAAASAGLLFGTGLLVSGMTDPQRVLSFLDLAGTWNPALALVMGGAIAVAAPAFYWSRRQLTSATQNLERSASQRVDRELLVGSSIFGIGWGLSGICPGPGLMLLASGRLPALVFVIAMAGGMWLARLIRESHRDERRD